MRKWPRKSGFPHSAGAAWCVTALVFAGFGVLFRFGNPGREELQEHSGKNCLLTLTPERHALATWLDIHDPGRIVLGSHPPLPLKHEAPPQFPKQESMVLPEEPEILDPSPAETVSVGQGWDFPGERYRADAPVFPVPPKKSYPRMEWNGVPQNFSPSEELLKLAASVNAGTAEILFSEGVLPEERRWTMIRSSGNSRLDRELIRQFGNMAFPEFPVRMRLIWDAAGEDK